MNMNDNLIYSEKYKYLDHVLGKKPDAEVGKEFNLTRQRVQQIRSARKIPKFEPNKPKKLTEVMETYPELIERLGKEPDTDLTREYKLSEWVIPKMRKLLGIPKYKQPVRERFWSQVDKRAYCDLKTKEEDVHWIWIGSITNNYPRFVVGANKHVLARRASYSLFKGRVGSRVPVYNVCGETLCVNPDHLTTTSGLDFNSRP